MNREAAYRIGPMTTARDRLRTVVRHWSFKEIILSFKLTWPIALSYILQQSVYTISIALAGHAPFARNSTIIVEAVSLSVSIIGVSGLCIVIGLCSAIDTLASQAWGAGNFTKLGIYIQRSIFILGLATLLIYCFWFNLESILHLLQQPPCVIDYTVQYVQVYCTCLPAVVLYNILQRYLLAQNIVYPFVVTGLIGNVVSAFAHYMFLYVADWGVRGVAGAIVLTTYITLFSLLAIIYVRKLHVKTWGGWSRDSLNGWGQFARFGIPGFVMLFAEWGSFELGFVLTGVVGTLQQTLYALIMNWLYILFQFPLSIAIAANIRVGNEIGAGNVKQAKRAAIVGGGVMVAWLLFITTINLALKSYIPRLFTVDDALIAKVNVHMILMAVICLADHPQVLLGGILRGLGRQALGAAGNALSFWVIGVPLGIGLLFGAKLGALGFLVGLASASYLQVITYCVIIAGTNWTKQASKARKIAGVTDAKDDNDSAITCEDEVLLQPLGEGTEDSSSLGEDDHLQESCLSDDEAMINLRDAEDCDSGLDCTLTNGILTTTFTVCPKEEKSALSLSIEGSFEPVNTSSAKDSKNIDDLTSSDMDSQSAEVELVPLLEADGDWTEKNSQLKIKHNKPHLTQTTIVVRILTVLFFVILLAGSVVLSQVYVYRPSVCDGSNATNTSANLTSSMTYHFNGTLVHIS